MSNNPYQQQVELLLKVIPYVFKHSFFALKGGTAINLYYRNMPRFSVDIDLCFLPVVDRKETYTKIHKTLDTIKSDIEKYQKLKVTLSTPTHQNKETKLTVYDQNISIKIEPNYILRGSVYEVNQKELCIDAKQQFQLENTIQCLDIADIYGGKLCAALDRQHPRDIFDIMILLNNEGITEEIKNSFIYHLLSSNRPIHELLEPNEVDIEQAYLQNFLGMSTTEVSLNKLLSIRKKFFALIKNVLKDQDKQFLLSFVQNQPNWELYAFPKIKEYPSIKWKLLNQSKMNEQKSKDYIKKVKQTLNI